MRWESCSPSWLPRETSSRCLFNSARLGYGKSLCLSKTRRRLKKNVAAKRSCHQRSQNPLNGNEYCGLGGQQWATNCAKGRTLLWVFPPCKTVQTVYNREVIRNSSWVDALDGESKAIEGELLIRRPWSRKTRQQKFLERFSNRQDHSRSKLTYATSFEIWVLSDEGPWGVVWTPGSLSSQVSSPLWSTEGVEVLGASGAPRSLTSSTYWSLV